MTERGKFYVFGHGSSSSSAIRRPAIGSRHEDAASGGGKRKLSRKAQIREFARIKKKAADGDRRRSQLRPTHPWQMKKRRKSAEPAAAVRKTHGAERQRRRYRAQQRDYMLDSSAHVLQGWMRSDPRNEEILLRRELEQLAASTVSAAVQTAVRVIEAERLEQERAQHTLRLLVRGMRHGNAASQSKCHNQDRVVSMRGLRVWQQLHQ